MVHRKKGRGLGLMFVTVLWRVTALETGKGGIQYNPFAKHMQAHLDDEPRRRLDTRSYITTCFRQFETNYAKL